MNYFDLTSPLIADTILIVKKENENDKSKLVWVVFNIPINRKNNTQRTYGDLYNYFSNLDGFRFAKGYVRQGDGTTEPYNYKFQYLYFSREEPPMMDHKELPQIRYYNYK